MGLLWDYKIILRIDLQSARTYPTMMVEDSLNRRMRMTTIIRLIENATAEQIIGLGAVIVIGLAIAMIRNALSVAGNGYGRRHIGRRGR